MWREKFVFCCLSNSALEKPKQKKVETTTVVVEDEDTEEVGETLLT